MDLSNFNIFYQTPFFNNGSIQLLPDTSLCKNGLIQFHQFYTWYPISIIMKPSYFSTWHLSSIIDPSILTTPFFNDGSIQFQQFLPATSSDKMVWSNFNYCISDTPFFIQWTHLISSWHLFLKLWPYPISTVSSGHLLQEWTLSISAINKLDFYFFGSFCNMINTFLFGCKQGFGFGLQQ